MKKSQIMSQATAYENDEELSIRLAGCVNVTKVLVLGVPGTGKSFLLNALIGRQVFDSKTKMGSVTKQCEYYVSHQEGDATVFLNVPGVEESTAAQVGKAFRILPKVPTRVVFVAHLRTDNGRCRLTDFVCFKALHQCYPNLDVCATFVVNMVPVPFQTPENHYEFANQVHMTVFDTQLSRVMFLEDVPPFVQAPEHRMMRSIETRLRVHLGRQGSVVLRKVRDFTYTTDNQRQAQEIVHQFRPGVPNLVRDDERAASLLPQPIRVVVDAVVNTGELPIAGNEAPMDERRNPPPRFLADVLRAFNEEHEQRSDEKKLFIQRLSQEGISCNGGTCMKPLLLQMCGKPALEEFALYVQGLVDRTDCHSVSIAVHAKSPLELFLETPLHQQHFLSAMNAHLRYLGTKEVRPNVSTYEAKLDPITRDLWKSSDRSAKEVFPASPHNVQVVDREKFGEENYKRYSSGFDLMGRWEVRPLGAYVESALFWEVVDLPKLIVHKIAGRASDVIPSAEVHKFKRFIAHYLKMPLPWLDKESVALALTDVGTVLSNQDMLDNLRPLFDKLTTTGISPPRGLLLWGPPGTGKTTVASMLGKRTGMVLVSCDKKGFAGSEMADGLKGGTEKNVKTLFQRSLAAPWLLHALVIDEIETLVLNRKRSKSEDPQASAVLAMVLTYFQGLSDDAENVFLFGATNMKMELDPAFERRMHGKIFVGLPSLHDRRMWRRVRGVSNAVVSGKVSEFLSSITVGFSAANMNLVLEELELRWSEVRGDLTKACIFQAVQSVCIAQQVHMGALSVPDMLVRTGSWCPPVVGVPTSQIALQWKWFESDFGCLAQVVSRYLKEANLTGRFMINLSAAAMKHHDTMLPSMTGDPSVEWEILAPCIDIELRQRKLHTLRPQMCGANISRFYPAQKIHFSSLLVDFAYALDITYVRVIDTSFFIRAGCDEEKKMIELLWEEVAQCTASKRALLLLDLDCTCVDTIDDDPNAITNEAQGQDKNEMTLHQVFSSMMEIVRNSAFVNETTETCLMVFCVTAFVNVARRAEAATVWPQSSAASARYEQQKYLATPQRCDECHCTFTPRANIAEFGCRPHRDRNAAAPLVSTAPLEEQVLMPATTLIKLGGLPACMRQTYVWSCCGQSWSTTECGLPSQAQRHRPSLPFKSESATSSLQTHSCANRSAYHMMNAVTDPAISTSLRIRWCNMCGVGASSGDNAGCRCCTKCHNTAVPVPSSTRCDACTADESLTVTRLPHQLWFTQNRGAVIRIFDMGQVAWLQQQHERRASLRNAKCIVPWTLTWNHNLHVFLGEPRELTTDGEIYLCCPHYWCCGCTERSPNVVVLVRLTKREGYTHRCRNSLWSCREKDFGHYSGLAHASNN